MCPPWVIFGGVHGLERIGAEVVLAYLHNLVMRLQWDSGLHRQLETVRLVFMPIVNSGRHGARHARQSERCRPDAQRAGAGHRTRAVFGGGQRISAGLPWYRGVKDKPMELENQAVCEVVTAELLSRDFSLSVDCILVWQPRPPLVPLCAQACDDCPSGRDAAFKNILSSRTATTLCDRAAKPAVSGPRRPVDHLYLQACEQPQRVFLPLTLEMGSWLWVKKNPRQLFSRHGMFNPLIEHRQQRVLRQHLLLLDFLVARGLWPPLWLPTPENRAQHHAQALQDWY